MIVCACRCFAYWGMSSTVHNAAGVKSRWQERGGSAGYSTNCVGAATSPTATPGQYQVGRTPDDAQPMLYRLQLPGSMCRVHAICTMQGCYILEESRSHMQGFCILYCTPTHLLSGLHVIQHASWHTANLQIDVFCFNKE